jgi:hypothetical protein
MIGDMENHQSNQGWQWSRRWRHVSTYQLAPKLQKMGGDHLSKMRNGGNQMKVFLKINIDGAFVQDSCEGAVGAVVRSSSGLLRVASAR